MKKIIGLLCFMTLFVSCEKVILVDKIWLDTTSLELFVGDEYSLKTVITPMEANDKGLSWSSSNVSVATVNSYGRITAINAGSSTITVQSNDGGALASCNVVVKIDTRPSYSLETEEILLQSFKIYKDEISVFYEKKIVIQTNPNATVTEEQIQQLQHIQDSIEFSKACCYNYYTQEYFEFIWYFPVTVKVNGQSTSIEKYISYEPDYESVDHYNKETYEARKHIIDTLNIETVLEAVSSADLYGWYLSKDINSPFEGLIGMIDFHSKSGKDRFKLADRSLNPNVVGTQIELETHLFNIPSYNNNVESFCKSLYNITFDRFNDRVYYDYDGNKYLTVVSENSIEKIKDFNIYGVITDIDNYQPYFPKVGYIYPTILFYKNDELILETVLLGYSEYFDHDSEKNLTRTDIYFGSCMLKDNAQFFLDYQVFYDERRFIYTNADYSTGSRIDSGYKIVIARDEKANGKSSLSYE